MAAGDAEGEPTGDITAKVVPLDKTYVVEIGSDQKRMEGPAHSPPSMTALALILPILRLIAGVSFRVFRKSSETKRNRFFA